MAEDSSPAGGLDGMGVTGALARTLAGGGRVDPAAFLRISLDPSLRTMTPTHWAYEMVQAVLGGDADFIDSLVKSHAHTFDVSFLSEPLGGSGQSILHVAALMNRPAIVSTLLGAADRALHAQAVEQKLSIRHETLVNKAEAVDAAETRVKLAKELDKVDRLFHIKCEQQYLMAMSTLDGSGRTVLHYCAAARGVMVPHALAHKEDRFRAPTTCDMAPPCLPLFPEGAYVSPVTGDVWQAVWYEFPQDHPPQEVPEGFIAVRDLLRARTDAIFIDARDVNEATPLHFATVANDVKGIRALLSYGADAFAVTKQGAKPLELADNRAVRVALLPIENALQVTVGQSMARPGLRTPLGASSTVAFAANAVSTARVRKGTTGLQAEVEAPSAGERKSAAEEALLFLVNSGEDINGRTGCKLQAPLHVAADKGCLDVVQLLLGNGAIVDVVDVNGCTPLHYAAELGTEVHMQIVQALFDAGADVNATSSVRKTPLLLAAAGGPHFQSGTGLIPPAVEGVEPADAAAVAPGPPGGTGDGNSAMLQLLTSLGAKLEASDIEGNTALIAAAKRGNHLGVQTLLTLGARIYGANIRGHTALHVAAFVHQLPIVRQLVRWDAEVGKLKFQLDSSGRSAYDMAADPPTREALHSLFEASASGSLDLAQSVTRQTRLLPPIASAPWLPVRVWETTRIMRRTALHCAVTGAAKAMAVLRKDIAGVGGSAAVAAAAAGKANKVADALSKAIVQRREREQHVDPAKGTGIPDHRIAPSAARIVAGVGLRFVPVPADPRLPGLPHPDYRAWGGNFADVVLTFPELRDAVAVGQFVDRAAFVPKPGAHTAFINPALLGDTTRSAAAAARVVPGNELTSAPTEKGFGRIVDFLLRSGVDANAGDADGVTATMLAAKFGLLFILRKLLQRGADPALGDAAGNTALHYARAWNQAAAAAILTEYTTDGSGGSVLDNAPNAAGSAPADVAGTGTAIFPDTSESLVCVARVPKRSGGLAVTQAI